MVRSAKNHQQMVHNERVHVASSQLWLMYSRLYNGISTANVRVNFAPSYAGMEGKLIATYNA
jgi:hypothetical protein